MAVTFDNQKSESAGSNAMLFAEYIGCEIFCNESCPQARETDVVSRKGELDPPFIFFIFLLVFLTIHSDTMISVRLYS
jgi:hypothetical protein